MRPASASDAHRFLLSRPGNNVLPLLIAVQRCGGGGESGPGHPRGLDIEVVDIHSAN